MDWILLPYMLIHNLARWMFQHQKEAYIWADAAFLWPNFLNFTWYAIIFLTSIFCFFWQYFQMDPYNYDEYGGIQHALYCFQVLSSWTNLIILLVLVIQWNSCGVICYAWNVNVNLPKKPCHCSKSKICS